MNSDKKNILLILLVGILAWIPVLNFWFFKAYEATWLMSVTPHTFFNLLKGHAFLYFLDLKLFGWNPAGWYATGILLHLIAGSIFYFLIKSLTRNHKIALIAGLIFIANSAYIDAVAWGSFNSYYPLLLSFMLLSLYLFNQFLIKKRILQYGGSILFLFLGFFIRETGLVLVPLLTFFDLASTFIHPREKQSRKEVVSELKKLILRQTPIYLILIVFYFFRSWYGGIAGDHADSLVKWRIRLVEDGLYPELLWAMILTSGKLLAPQLIPYPVLNFIRDIFLRIFPTQIVGIYFFPFVGLVFYGLLGLITFWIKKNKLLFSLMLFFMVWIAAFSLFVSLAVPSDTGSLLDRYDWILMRYRYFAFAGTSAIFGIIIYLFYEKIKKKFNSPGKIAKFAVILIVSSNIIFIWKLEQDIYAKSFKPSKDFYSQFKKEFPRFEENPTFYLYPHTPGLNDYMLEWYFIEGDNFYTKLYQIESQMEAVLTKLKKGQLTLNNTFFLDYEPKKGLINKTEEARKAVLNRKEYNLDLKKTIKNEEAVFESDTFQGPFVELPVDLNLSISSSAYFVPGGKPDSQRFRKLADYIIERKQYLDTVKIKTSITMSQRENEPFFHVLPRNLTDGNTGFRSFWIVDDGITLITADLGQIQEIDAALWGSQKGSPRIPATYSYQVSNDGKNWKTVKEVKNYSKENAIDKFDKPINARFIRMNIQTTSKGDYALVDEFEVVGAKGKGVLNYYNDRNLLLSESLNLFQFLSSQLDLDYALTSGLNFYFAKLAWDTNLTDRVAHEQFWYFTYPIGQENVELVVPIREGEIFAGPGQFLNKRITGIEINFGKVQFNVNINSSKIVPRY
ncbi:MAG: Conserved hypothetical tpr repeat protein [Microgenomates group bacterium GW2011_GWA2_37_6]|nr:MAG: Conserved hypothetical tpr repeat protein [Microgenomates group bacterium GW2011_GWA2_37_6]